MVKLWFLFALLFSLGLAACQEAPAKPEAVESRISATPLSYKLLAEYPWKQLTRDAGKFSLCRFSRDEADPNRLHVTISTGEGINLQGQFRFTDNDEFQAQRTGLFTMEGGLIEEPVTLRLLPKDQSLIIIDSMGQEQKLRRVDGVSRSR